MYFLKFLGPSEKNYNLQSLMITLYHVKIHFHFCPKSSKKCVNLDKSQYHNKIKHVSA